MADRYEGKCGGGYEGKTNSAASSTTIPTTASSSFPSSSSATTSAATARPDVMSSLVDHLSSRTFRSAIASFLDREAVGLRNTAGAAESGAGHSFEALAVFDKWTAFLDNALDAFADRAMGVSKADVEDALRRAALADETTRLASEGGGSGGSEGSGGGGSGDDGKMAEPASPQARRATTRMYFLQRLLGSWELEGWLRLVDSHFKGGGDSEDSSDDEDDSDSDGG